MMKKQIAILGLALNTFIGSALWAGLAPDTPGNKNDQYSSFPKYQDIGYDQVLRPQFHFTSRKNWLNDPNGMVYSDGEWHMLFQHNALVNNTGMKSWGNAVSTDLMHWTQLPHAINPYSNVLWDKGREHSIWSGSAVVDVDNILGKQKGDIKTLFALYTATHRGADKKTAFFQGGAYSTDKGRTWSVLNGGKAIIPFQVDGVGGQRDPRIFYYAPGKFYVTIMMIGGKERAVRLWKSTDLIHWDKMFDLPNKSAECIDMYELAVDGDPNNKKWVIADANTRYEVGEFDGKSWKGFGAVDENDNPLKFEYGDAYYAAQAFNQAPKNRVVHVGWLRSKAGGYRPFLEAGMPFTQQMSIPAEITLRNTPKGLRVYRMPVKEIQGLYSQSHKLGSGTPSQINAKLKDITPELIDLSIAFSPKGNASFSIRGITIDYDMASQQINFENTERYEGEKKGWKKKDRPYPGKALSQIPAPLMDGVVKLRVLIDRASLEIFVNDGSAAGSFVVVPKPDNRSISIEGNLNVQSMEVHELKSAWDHL
ncbi:MAG: glycoside hydrolase family 32 protein [Planctomycetes bacterium]|nr:glycoside hydrolase family 32 protein [Planctomycetota bacterium]